jgi:hypothetical protein
MDYKLALLGLVLVVVIINLPLGYLRQNYEKFSFGWYICVHISIPIIIYLRIKSGFSWNIIPLTVGGAVAGQILGGKINKRRKGNGQQKRENA